MNKIYAVALLCCINLMLLLKKNAKRYFNHFSSPISPPLNGHVVVKLVTSFCGACLTFIQVLLVINRT